MLKTELVPNTVYWITDNKPFKRTYTPMLYNIDKKWKLVVGELMTFISTITLEKIFGTGCVVRPVDGNLDKGHRPEGDNTSPLPFMLAPKNGKTLGLIILKSSFCCIMDSTSFPDDYFDNYEGHYLVYNNNLEI